MRVSEKSLGHLKLISEGGFGKVYRVTDYQLPGDPTALAYKEFTIDVANQARSAERAVGFRAAMDLGAQARLDQVAVWPRALVEDEVGAVIGLLMPLIPDDFFFKGNDVMTGKEKNLARGIEWLFTDTAYLAKAQVDISYPDPTERLILLGKLVYAVGRLHKLGWVFGDISGKNAVWALRPPRVLLLDCDGAAPLTDLSRVQGTTPTWEPPEFGTTQHALQNGATDVYKLGLAILRALTQTMQAKDPGRMVVGKAVDVTGAMLITRAVNPNPSVRPTAKELYEYLQRVVASVVRPPQVAFARLRKPFLIRGQDARVDWQIANATEVTVSAGGHHHQVDPKQHFDGYSFRMDHSGTVTLTLSNYLGSIVVDLGEVSLYELPSFSANIPPLPAPQIPDLPALSLDSMAPVLNKVPVIQLPNLPSMPSPQTYDLVDTLMRGTTITMAPPGIATAVLDASQVVFQAIWEDAHRRAEAARPVP
jgi:serine/threonine protein kinase